ALLELINDVLDLSKLEAGQMQLILEKVDFEALLNEMATIFKIKCAEQQIYIRLECVNKLPELWLDKLRLRQILFNLIGNAVKFTEHGGVNVVVDFSAVSESEGVLTFHVIDTGCGIPEAEQKQLFQIFVQASSARTNATSTGNGSGLGLAICRRLIEQMKGKIELHSQVGVGSDFTVMLPNVRFEAGVNKKKIQTVGRGKVSYRRDYHALIVDDGAMLKKLGVYTIAASGGVEALAALDREKIDFVLTDMWMPEMNGAELATQIRSQEKFANLPIYAVTADIEAQENFSVELFSGILLKPISIEKFQRLLNELA
ncbi:MAG: ATP-binding protein, partial [Victivallaceae bacterium]